MIFTWNRILCKNDYNLINLLLFNHECFYIIQGQNNYQVELTNMRYSKKINSKIRKVYHYGLNKWAQFEIPWRLTTITDNWRRTESTTAKILGLCIYSTSWLIYKQSRAGLNLEFFLLRPIAIARLKSQFYYLLIGGFILFSRVLVLCGMQTAPSKVQTWVAILW